MTDKHHLTQRVLIWTGLIILVLPCLVGIFWPVLRKAEPHVHRFSCARTLKQLGLALLMYSGDNDGYYPVQSPPAGHRLEPLGGVDITDDSPVFTVPSARQSLTLARNSNYRYRGSGLHSDEEAAIPITVIYASSNHPVNGWLDPLVIDGHVRDTKPDGKTPTDEKAAQ